jgi:hypothetical protein
MKLYSALVAVTTDTLLGIAMPSIGAGVEVGLLPVGLGVTVVPLGLLPLPHALSIVAIAIAYAARRIFDIVNFSCRGD